MSAMQIDVAPLQLEFWLICQGLVISVSLRAVVVTGQAARAETACTHQNERTVTLALRKNNRQEQTLAHARANNRLLTDRTTASPPPPPHTHARTHALLHARTHWHQPPPTLNTSA
jgi:hypothetical protein